MKDVHWALFNCGMTEFRRRLMTAEFDACPLSDLSLWGQVGTLLSLVVDDACLSGRVLCHQEVRGAGREPPVQCPQCLGSAGCRRRARVNSIRFGAMKDGSAF
jgi:hypothetical protein